MSVFSLHPDAIVATGSGGGGGRTKGQIGPRRTAAEARRRGRAAARPIAPVGRGRSRTQASTAGARIARRLGGTVRRTGTVQVRGPGRPRRR